MNDLRRLRQLPALITAVALGHGGLALHAQGISTKDLLDGLSNPSR
jgi:hypothetical protein